MEREKLLAEIKEFTKDCSYEEVVGDTYCHPQYITGFPLFLEDILYYLIGDISDTNEDNWTEARYLILKYKEIIDLNFQRILKESNLKENLFKGIKDIENFKDFM